MQDINNFFDKKTKQPLFVLSSNRAKFTFSKYFSSNANLYMDVDTINLDSNDKLNSYDIFNFDYTKVRDFESVFLPNIFSVDEFFKKIIFAKLPLVSKNARFFFMMESLREVRSEIIKENDKGDKKLFSFTNNLASFDENFISYLETSRVLTKFYDELLNHRKAISWETFEYFIQKDNGEIHSEELKILYRIYTRFLKKMEINNLCAGFISEKNAKNYELDSKFLQLYSCIHIDLDGFIPPLKYEILRAAADFLPIYLHFKTDRYSVQHFEFLNKEIEINKQYIFCINNEKLYSKDIESKEIKPVFYKTQNRFNQVNLALKLGSLWLSKIYDEKNNYKVDENGAKITENDFAVIVPDESFRDFLFTMDGIKDSKSGSVKPIFNYAMGEDLQNLKEFQILQKIYTNYKETNIFNIKEIIDYIESNKLNDNKNIPKATLQDIKETNDNYEIPNPNLQKIQNILIILFLNVNQKLLNQAIEILTELYFIEKISKNTSFKTLFISFMEDFSTLSIDNINGGDIRVIGVLEARNLKFREVLILDFNDDIIANVSFDDMFLNSTLRKQAGLPTKKDKENLQKHHYYNIMQNTQITHISYVENDEKLPSSLLYELGFNLRDSINIDETYIYYDTENGKKLSLIESNDNSEFPDSKEKLHEFKEKLKSNKENKETLTQGMLKDYKECTRRFYLKHIEKLELENTNSAPSVGKKIHKFLEISYTGYENKNEPLNENDINEIEKTFNELCAKEYNKLRQNTQSSDTLDIESYIKFDNLCKKMTQFFDYERQRVKENDITILGVEVKFNGYCNINGENINCAGKIDRIDKICHKNKETKIAFIDYKTSYELPTTDYKKTLSETQENKIDLQMPFYKMNKDSINFLKEYSDEMIESYYAHLKDFNNLTLISDNIMKIGETKIKDILKEFNKNEKCSTIENCKYCQYTTLCGRD